MPHEQRLREEWNSSVVFPHDEKGFHRSKEDEFYGNQIAIWWLQKMKERDAELHKSWVEAVKKDIDAAINQHHKSNDVMVGLGIARAVLRQHSTKYDE